MFIAMRLRGNQKECNINTDSKFDTDATVWMPPRTFTFRERLPRGLRPAFPATPAHVVGQQFEIRTLAHLEWCCDRCFGLHR